MGDEELLRTVPIFSELSEADIASLARLTSRRSCPKDTVVFFENEEGDSFFIIVDGRIKVTILGDDGREVILSVLGRGDFFGEMALLEKHRRTATVTATSDLTIVVMHERDFRAMEDVMPDVANRIRGVMDDRRRSDERRGSES